MAGMDAMLKYLVDQKGSDLHLSAGALPRIRRHGSIEPIPNQKETTDAQLKRLFQEIAPPAAWRTYTDTRDVDFAYAVAGVARFRVNLFRQDAGAAAVFRVVPEEIVPLESLSMPPAVAAFSDLNEGLVLVTGPTGSGKSTTLAAIVDRINKRHHKHVVTIEDPVEFVHTNFKCVFSHREVGRHTRAFAPALRAASRQDVDVLLVGEMRDHETISLALTAAEMGMLVFGTLHTNSATKTIDRLIDAFPAAQQSQARLTLSESLAGVVSQLLIKTTDGTGRVAAVEVLVRTPALPNLIREGNLPMLYSGIQSGRGQGMQTMDQALLALVNDGRITADDAYTRAMDKSLFEHLPRKDVVEEASRIASEVQQGPALAEVSAPGGGKMVILR